MALARDMAPAVAVKDKRGAPTSNRAPLDAESIAREAQGHPMFIAELVRYSSLTKPETGPVRLDDAPRRALERARGGLGEDPADHRPHRASDDAGVREAGLLVRVRRGHAHRRAPAHHPRDTRLARQHRACRALPRSSTRGRAQGHPREGAHRAAPADRDGTRIGQGRRRGGACAPLARCRRRRSGARLPAQGGRGSERRPRLRSRGRPLRFGAGFPAPSLSPTSRRSSRSSATP